MRVSSKLDKDRVVENWCLPMVRITRENFIMVNFMVKGHINGMINVNTQDLGKIIKFMAMGLRIGLMEEDTRESNKYFSKNRY